MVATIQACRKTIVLAAVYRAAEALEKFTQGAIRFEKHQRHGWMLIGDGEIVKQLRGRSSSAGMR